jgi:hypothetical protein
MPVWFNMSSQLEFNEGMKKHPGCGLCMYKDDCSDLYFKVDELCPYHATCIGCNKPLANIMDSMVHNYGDCACKHSVALCWRIFREDNKCADRQIDIVDDGPRIDLDRFILDQ